MPWHALKGRLGLLLMHKTLSKTIFHYPHSSSPIQKRVNLPFVRNNHSQKVQCMTRDMYKFEKEWMICKVFGRNVKKTTADFDLFEI